MRLSKTAWLILGIGIFVIAFGSLFMVYSRQTGEQERLEDDLSAAQALWPQLISEREDLESQLAQLESQLTQATSSLSSSKARFPKSVQSIEYDEALFDIADECDLEIMELTASEPRDKKVEDITYTTTTFEVVVRSKELPPSTVDKFETYIDETVADMLEFINIIATGEDFTTATIELVNMEKLEPPDAEDLEDADKAARRDMGPEATVQLIIYGFPR